MQKWNSDEAQINNLNTINWCETLAADVTSSERKIFHSDAVLYNKEHIKTEGIIDNNIKLLKAYREFKQYDVDEIYLCSFPSDCKIGYYYNNEYIVPEEYNNVFKLVITRQSHNPMIFYQFLTDTGKPEAVKYVKKIIKNVKF